MFQWLNSYGANNVVEFGCTIKTKVILHTTVFWKIEMEVSVVFLNPVSIIVGTLGTSTRFSYLKELFLRDEIM